MEAEGQEQRVREAIVCLALALFVAVSYYALVWTAMWPHHHHNKTAFGKY
jgi:hypothetical protein